VLAISLGACVLPLRALAQVEPSADYSEPHGYVEPCSLSFVADGTMQCQECAPSPSDPELCTKKLIPLGYEKKCRTSAHSAPNEVWCISNLRQQAMARKARAAREEKAAGRFILAAAVAASAALLGGFLFLKRRQRPATEKAGPGIEKKISSR
jgi:hypothetical protein